MDILSARGEMLTANRIQLVLLGPSGSGKTSLVNNLQRPGFEKESDSTEGLAKTSSLIEAYDSQPSDAGEKLDDNQRGPLLQGVGETDVPASMLVQAAITSAARNPPRHSTSAEPPWKRLVIQSIISVIFTAVFCLLLAAFYGNGIDATAFMLFVLGNTVLLSIGQWMNDCSTSFEDNPQRGCAAAYYAAVIACAARAVRTIAVSGHPKWRYFFTSLGHYATHIATSLVCAHRFAAVATTDGHRRYRLFMFCSCIHIASILAAVIAAVFAVNDTISAVFVAPLSATFSIAAGCVGAISFSRNAASFSGHISVQAALRMFAFFALKAVSLILLAFLVTILVDRAFSIFPAGFSILHYATDGIVAFFAGAVAFAPPALYYAERSTRNGRWVS